MQWKRKINIFIGILFIILLVIPLQFTNLKQYVAIPNHVTMFQNESILSIPKLDNTTVTIHPSLSTNHPYGESEFVYKYGSFPIKRVNVAVMKEHEVVPGGQ